MLADTRQLPSCDIGVVVVVVVVAVVVVPPLSAQDQGVRYSSGHNSSYTEEVSRFESLSSAVEIWTMTRIVRLQ